MIIIGYSLTVLYGLLSAIVAVLGIKETKKYSTIIMLIGAIELICSSIYLTYQNDFIWGVVLGLILIQTAAIINGYAIYGKFNFKHQIIRLIFGIILLAILIVFK